MDKLQKEELSNHTDSLVLDLAISSIKRKLYNFNKSQNNTLFLFKNKSKKETFSQSFEILNLFLTLELSKNNVTSVLSRFSKEEISVLKELLVKGFFYSYTRRELETRFSDFKRDFKEVGEVDFEDMRNVVSVISYYFRSSSLAVINELKY